MKEISTFHDGSFDGLCITGHDVHFFLNEFWSERSTIVLRGVENMMMNEIMQGNIILELRFIPSEKLEIKDMRDLLLGGDDSKYLPKLLATAREKQLSVLEVHTSYGAQGKVLFRAVEVLPGYVLPSLDSKTASKD